MPSVVYGSGHTRTLIGSLKILEIFCMTLALILAIVRGVTGVDYLDAFLAGTIMGLIMSFLIVTISSTTAAAKLENVLRFQYICHLILFIYMVVVSAILIHRTKDVAKLFTQLQVYPAAGAVGLVGALAYLLDAFFSYKAYGN